MKAASALSSEAPLAGAARSVRGARPLRDATELRDAVSRIRAALTRDVPAERIADTLGATFETLRSRTSAARRDTLRKIGRSSGWSYALLDESVDALLRPFTRRALDALAERVRARREVFGFVMPGNVPGAGIHELTLALLAGAGVVVKAASAEPVFFNEFARAISEIDRSVGERLTVFAWDRGRSDLTATMRESVECLIAFGDHSTIDALARDGRIIGFGSRLSAAVMGSDAACGANLESAASAVARDVTLFEQHGCLSPHQVFVEAASTDTARGFAVALAGELTKYARRLPPPARLPLEAAAAIRREREVARWRALGGGEVALFEGRRLGWTVIFDPAASITPSPGYRTVRVSVIANLDELKARLAPASGRLEAVSVASGNPEAYAAAMRSLGVTYVSAPGAMQSPPLDWPHGGGAMLELAGITP